MTSVVNTTAGDYDLTKTEDVQKLSRCLYGFKAGQARMLAFELLEWIHERIESNGELESETVIDVDIGSGLSLDDNTIDPYTAYLELLQRKRHLVDRSTVFGETLFGDSLTHEKIDNILSWIEKNYPKVSEKAIHKGRQIEQFIINEGVNSIAYGSSKIDVSLTEGLDNE